MDISPINEENISNTYKTYKTSKKYISLETFIHNIS